MKRLIFILYAIFLAGISFADTQTIAWYVDNNVYTTTTCEPGNDISLPTNPTKTGYNFIGWQEQTVFRGNYLNWSLVPTSATYKADAVGDTYPKYHDKIIVDDASGWSNPNSYVKVVLGNGDLGCQIIVDGVALEAFTCWGWNGNYNMTVGNAVKIRYWRDTGKNQTFYTAGTPVRYNGVTYPADYGKITEWSWQGNPTTLVFTTPEYLVGQQEFIYEGDWATDGKSGWVPVSTPLTE